MSLQRGDDLVEGRSGRLGQLEVHSTTERFLVRDTSHKRFQAAATLEGDELLLIIRTKLEDGTRSTLLRGSELFTSALRHFEGRFKAIRGSWHYGDNIAEVNELTAKGMPLLEAAKKTWTGKRAAEAGFTRVSIRHADGRTGAYTDVLAIFSKP